MTETPTPTPEAVAETVKGLRDRCGPAQYDPLAAKAADMLEALAADLAAQKARADALRRSYDELYADALADAQSDAQEFEGDLWKLLRDYLTKLNLDWSDYTDDGITAEQAIEHIRECMDGETARADALKNDKAFWENRENVAVHRAEVAEAKVARLVEALEFYADRSLDGYDVQVTDYGLSTENGPIIEDAGERARAAIAEVQG